MLTLPTSPLLPVQHLAAGFDEVTNSYKFYWFLAILKQLQEKQSPRMAIRDLLARMVAESGIQPIISGFPLASKTAWVRLQFNLGWMPAWRWMPAGRKSSSI